MNEVSDVLTTKNKGKTSYTDAITAMHPTYLHDMWHQSTRILGDAANSKKLPCKSTSNQQYCQTIRRFS